MFLQPSLSARWNQRRQKTTSTNDPTTVVSTNPSLQTRMGSRKEPPRGNQVSQLKDCLATNQIDTFTLLKIIEQEDSKSATHSTTLIAYPSLSSHLASPSGQVDMQVDSPNLHAKIHTLNSPNPSLSKFHSIDTQSSALINLSHIPHNITPAFISQNVTPPSPTPLQNTFTPSTTSHQISNQPHEQLPPPLAHHQLGYATQPLPPFHPPQSWIEQGLQG